MSDFLEKSFTKVYGSTLLALREGWGSNFQEKTYVALERHLRMVLYLKVTIFQECEPEFLHDVVLKMKALIFTPGDLVIRRGEVAREMFIISDGMLEVIGYVV